MPGPPLSRRAYLFHLLLLRNGANSPKSWKYHVGRLLVFLSYLYVGILALLLFLENRLLFHPTTAAQKWEDPPPYLEVQDVELIAADGVHIHSWWTTPQSWKPDDGAVLLCHGNAGNISMWGWQIGEWVIQRKQAVLAFDYPGFGKSSGSPTEAGCYAAADAAYDYLTQTLLVPGTRVLLYGESLGGGVATDLASRHHCRALILASTFTSFPDLAQQLYPFFPGRWLVRNQFRNIEKIRNCHCPIFMGHGTADELIPFSQGQRLFAMANEPKRFISMSGLGHEPPTAEFYVHFMEFLVDVEKNKWAGPNSGN